MKKLILSICMLAFSGNSFAQCLNPAHLDSICNMYIQGNTNYSQARVPDRHGRYINHHKWELKTTSLSRMEEMNKKNQIRDIIYCFEGKSCKLYVLQKNNKLKFANEYTPISSVEAKHLLELFIAESGCLKM